MTPPVPPPPPGRPRPRGAWFGLAALMIAVGGVFVVVAIVLSIKGFTEIVADVPADGRSRVVDVDDDTEYLVWRHREEAVDCEIVNDDGSKASTSGLGATSYTRGSWEGLSTFEPTGARVTIRCAARTGDVQVGERPRLHTLLGSLWLGLVIPVLVGGAGLILLLVLGILFATGVPRERAQ